MKRLAILAMITATPAMAAEGHAAPFFSLHNPPFVVVIAFLIFLGIVIKAKVPGLVGKALDTRADQIRKDLEEARLIREEAQMILASYERKQKEVQAQADRIVAQAKSEAQTAAEQAKADLQASIARRLAAAGEQITSAEQGAMREVRDRAITVAVAAAGDLLTKQMNAKSANALIDDAIGQVGNRLN